MTWKHLCITGPVWGESTGHMDGFVQERCNSSALAKELHLSCTNPSTCGFPSQRAIMQSFDIFYVISLNKLLNEQSCCPCFETPTCDITLMVMTSVIAWFQFWYPSIFLFTGTVWCQCWCCSQPPYVLWRSADYTSVTTPHCTSTSSSTAPLSSVSSGEYMSISYTQGFVLHWCFISIVLWFLTVHIDGFV